jgi:hypothetical protein
VAWWWYGGMVAWLWGHGMPCPHKLIVPLHCAATVAATLCPYIVPILCPHIVPPHCASTLCLTIVSPQCAHIVLPYYALDCASTTVLPPSCGFPEFGGRNLRAEHGMAWVAADGSRWQQMAAVAWNGRGRACGRVMAWQHGGGIVAWWWCGGQQHGRDRA